MIAEATHNPLLILLYDTLRTQIRLRLDPRMEEVFGAEPGPKNITHDEHASFVEAIRAHNPLKAEQAMRLHLNSVRDHLFGLR
jgi:DNA-binding GntR family transcriptional regulator